LPPKVVLPKASLKPLQPASYEAPAPSKESPFSSQYLEASKRWLESLPKLTPRGSKEAKPRKGNSSSRVL
jgi:hypothetical protein